MYNKSHYLVETYETQGGGLCFDSSQLLVRLDVHSVCIMSLNQDSKNLCPKCQVSSTPCYEVVGKFMCQPSGMEGWLNMIEILKYLATYIIIPEIEDEI